MNAINSVAPDANAAFSGLQIVGIFLMFYLIPTWVAMLRHHRNTLAVFICNLFLGWTFFGWFVALIWACMRAPRMIVDTRP